ncbi:MAG: tetratricopeptide repeat protein [candidate division Zixibacteria bacterium]|nr:tetratricopeptide repeat protein [candidate division Zixibacteria bacterium]
MSTENLSRSGISPKVDRDGGKTQQSSGFSQAEYSPVVNEAINEAIELLNQQKYDDAKIKLQDYLRENKDDIKAIHLLGTIFAKQNDYINAERYFKKELELNPAQADAHFNLGLIHSQQNRLSEAKHDFENTIKLNPTDAHALNDLGVINFTLGDNEKSQDCFSKALEATPTFNDAFLNLFELLWNENKYDIALEYAYNFLKELSNKNSAELVNEMTNNNPVKQESPVQKSLKIQKA